VAQEKTSCCKITTTISSRNENKTLAAISIIITTMNLLNVLSTIQQGFDGMYDGEEEIYG